MAGLPELAAGSHRRSGAPLPIAPHFSFFLPELAAGSPAAAGCSCDLPQLLPGTRSRNRCRVCSRAGDPHRPGVCACPAATRLYIAVVAPLPLPLLLLCHCLRYYRQPLQLLRV